MKEPELNGWHSLRSSLQVAAEVQKSGRRREQTWDFYIDFIYIETSVVIREGKALEKSLMRKVSLCFSIIFVQKRKGIESSDVSQCLQSETA